MNIMATKYDAELWAFVALVVILIFSLRCSNDRDNAKSSKVHADSPSNIQSKATEVYIDLKKVIRNTHLKSENVIVEYDHFFKSPKVYSGYFINSILDSIVKAEGFDVHKTLLVFECVDGYKPLMELSKIYGKTKGYIVYKDLDRGLSKEWADSVYKKITPYYLVWDHVKKEDNSFVWPYGLTGIRLIKSDLEFQSIYPSKNTGLEKGFVLFRENCLKCHSINKVGGAMGPEFNIPRNITEYWNEKDIIAYAKNPTSFRYNSRMPPISNLSDSDMSQILEYVKFMKNNKLPK